MARIQSAFDGLRDVLMVIIGQSLKNFAALVEVVVASLEPLFVACEMIGDVFRVVAIVMKTVFDVIASMFDFDTDDLDQVAKCLRLLCPSQVEVLCGDDGDWSRALVAQRAIRRS